MLFSFNISQCHSRHHSHGVAALYFRFLTINMIFMNQFSLPLPLPLSQSESLGFYWRPKRTSSLRLVCSSHHTYNALCQGQQPHSKMCLYCPLLYSSSFTQCSVKVQQKKSHHLYSYQTSCFVNDN